MTTGVSRPESLVQRTTQVLRDLIERGRYGDTLPGEPRLASELKISRGTLRKALDSLAAEGRISASLPGSRRRIAEAYSRSGTQGARTVGVLVPRPLDVTDALTLAFLRELVAVTEPEGISLAVHHSAATHRKHPAKLLQTLVREQPADLWLLYEASIPVAHFFRAAEIPAIVCGGAGSAEGLPVCAYDGTAALRHAIGVFSRAKHTRIVAASRYHRPLRERVFREEFDKRGLRFEPQSHMPLWSDPEQLHHLLCTRLRGPDPSTAWIINGMEGLIVFFSTMLELGLRIPEDVSLLTFGSDPMLGCFRPAVSHYATPHRRLAVEVARMIRSQFESQSITPVSKLLQTVYVPGGSVGPVPSS